MKYWPQLFVIIGIFLVLMPAYYLLSYYIDPFFTALLGIVIVLGIVDIAIGGVLWKGK